MTKMAKNEVNKKWPKPMPKIYFFPPVRRWICHMRYKEGLSTIKKNKNRQLGLEGAENDKKWQKMRI